MNFKSYSLSKGLKYFIFLCFTSIVLLWNYQMLLPITFCVVFFLFTRRKNCLEITYLDSFFLITFICESLAFLFSSYQYNGIESFTLVSITGLLYLGAKFLFKKGKDRVPFLSMFIIGSTVMIVIALVKYVNLYDSFYKLFLSGYTSFKYLHSPFFIQNNAWASLLFLFFVFSVILFFYVKNRVLITIIFIQSLVITYSIIVSFSRGAYVSFFVFIILLTLFLFIYLNWKKALKITLALFISVTATVLPVWKDFKDTVSFNKTVSQQRSTKSRLDRWQYTKGIILDKPFTGWGQKNYVLSQNKHAFQEEDSRFSPSLNNTYLQILVEKGGMGLLGYLSSFLILFILLYKASYDKGYNKKIKLEIALIGTLLFCFLIKEFTYSTIFDYPLIWVILMIALYMLIPYDKVLFVIKFNRKKLAFLKPIGITALVIIVLYLNIKQGFLQQHVEQFVNYDSEGRYLDGELEITKAYTKSPKNISILKNKALILGHQAIKINVSNTISDFLDINVMDNQKLIEAKQTLMQILNESPLDAETVHNLAWVEFALNNLDEADLLFSKAIELDAYNSTFRISKILFDLKNNNDSAIINDFSSALRFSPSLIDSYFYKIFALKYPLIVEASKKSAITSLLSLSEESVIYKARLAKLKMDKNPEESIVLFREVLEKLPNLSRPWMYLGVLLSKENPKESDICFKRSIYLDKYDILTNLRYSEFLHGIHETEKSIDHLKRALGLYTSRYSNTLSRNYYFSNIPVLRNSFLPKDLIYYTSPDINPYKSFKTLNRFYNMKGDSKRKTFYYKLSDKYNKYDSVFKGEKNIL